MDTTQRRARLSVRHHLSTPASGPVDVARAMVALHSSDPVTVFLGIRARAPHVTPQEIEEALYTDRSLVRILGMRRTMFVVPAELAPVVHAGASRGLTRAQRSRALKMLTDGGVTDDAERWLSRACDAVLSTLRETGPATAMELSARIPELRKQIEEYRNGELAGRFGASTRVLFLLALEGRIVRARPRGGWTSTQYRWALMDDWLGTGIDVLETVPAQAELARLWLSAFGPGTRDDLKWWTGWTVAETVRALQGAGAVEIALDEGTGFALPEDLAPVRTPDPSVTFLPALDSTVMGWKHRDWYLGPHREALFDRNGNAGPTIWWEGRVVGGWVQDRDGRILYRLLEQVGKQASSAVEEEADAVREWLGDVRYVNRFRTPLERELRGS